MNQTRIPTEPGWYWFEPIGLRKRPVEVFLMRDLPHVRVLSTGSIELVSAVRGVWGGRISEGVIIGEKRVCVCGRDDLEVRACENCGKDFCSLHYSSVFVWDITVTLCAFCEDNYSRQAGQILQKFSQGKGLR